MTQYCINAPAGTSEDGVVASNLPIVPILAQNISEEDVPIGTEVYFAGAGSQKDGAGKGDITDIGRMGKA